MASRSLQPGNCINSQIAKGGRGDLAFCSLGRFFPAERVVRRFALRVAVSDLVGEKGLYAGVGGQIVPARQLQLLVHGRNDAIWHDDCSSPRILTRIPKGIDVALVEYSG